MDDEEAKYAVVIDAGSSGSRVFVYQWEVDPRGLKGPKINLVPGYTSNDINPGIATLAPMIVPVKAVDLNAPVHLSDQIQQPTTATISKETLKRVKEYLNPLLEHALTFIPPLEVKKTPLFILATGGMRRIQITQHESYQILCDAITNYLRTTGFKKPKFETISGEDEAMYGWVAVNFVDGCLKPGKMPHGFMELGGESAQFAVSIERNENAQYDGPLRLVKIWSGTYYVYVKSWMGIGGNTAWVRHLDNLRASDSVMPKDPCVPKGYSYRLSGSDKIVQGTGDFVGCMQEVLSLLGCPDPRCRDGDLCIYRNPGSPNSAGCLLRDKESGHPLLKFDTKKFHGASVYWHATHGVFRKPRESGIFSSQEDEMEDFNEFWKTVKHYSEMDWEELKAERPGGRKSDYKFLRSGFFTAALVMSTLFLGFGIPMPPQAVETTRGFARKRVEYAKMAAQNEEEDALEKSVVATAALQLKLEAAESAESAEAAQAAQVESAAAQAIAAEKRAAEAAEKAEKAEAKAAKALKAVKGAEMAAKAPLMAKEIKAYDTAKRRKAEAEEAKEAAQAAQVASAEEAKEAGMAAQAARAKTAKARAKQEEASRASRQAAVEAEAAAEGVQAAAKARARRAVVDAVVAGRKVEKSEHAEQVAEKRATQANVAMRDNQPVSPTEIIRGIIALNSIFHTVTNEPNKQDLMDAVKHTQGYLDRLDHCKLKAIEARRAKSKAADQAIQAYEKLFDTKKKHRDITQMKRRIDAGNDVDQRLNEAYTQQHVNTQYSSIKEAAWPLGRIVLHVADCTPKLVTKEGWAPP